MNTRPAISVLVGAYCHEEYVEQALDSLAAQSFKNFEVIITDDCSTDRTVERIHAWLERTGYPALFIENLENRGICAVRNRALDNASGEFVCSLSGDDWYEPDRLERQFDFFSSVPDNVALIYSDVNMCDASGVLSTRTWFDRRPHLKSAPPEGEIFLQLLRSGNFLPAVSAMARRSAIDVVGGYDSNLAYEDEYMWLQLAYRFHVRYAPGIVATYRVLPTSMSHSPAWHNRMAASEAKLLADWSGIDPYLDDLIAERLKRWTRRQRRRQIAAQGGAFDRNEARSFLRELDQGSPSRVWRVVQVSLVVPGSRWILHQLLRVSTVPARIRALRSADSS